MLPKACAFCPMNGRHTCAALQHFHAASSVGLCRDALRERWMCGGDPDLRNPSPPHGVQPKLPSGYRAFCMCGKDLRRRRPRWGMR